HFYQPGDQIEYTLTITNKSTVTAAIKSILVDNESVTSDTTKKKDNITYIIEMPESTTLAPNASTTMKVTAKFQNETDVTGAYSGETKTIEVKINAEQDDGNGGMDITPVVQTTTKYASTSQNVRVGDSIEPVLTTKWCDIETSSGTQYDCFDTESECNTFLLYNNYIETDTCQQKQVEYSDINIETYDSCAETNKNTCLKFTLSNGVVEKIEACLVKNGNEYCLQGGPDETSSAEAPIFNSNVLAIQNSLSGCGQMQTQSSNYECYENTYRMRAYKSGYVSAEDNGWACYANSALGYCALN
ncbi:MAG: hypothetical protein IKF82_06400, partial [Bacilli bacterium]|nr:hypothetical protein [Bacilli bacterium]